MIKAAENFKFLLEFFYSKMFILTGLGYLPAKISISSFILNTALPLQCKHFPAVDKNVVIFAEQYHKERENICEEGRSNVFQTLYSVYTIAEWGVRRGNWLANSISGAAWDKRVLPHELRGPPHLTPAAN